MNSISGGKIYEELGVKPVINAMGNMTLLGGSSLSPKVVQAMREANRYFVDMQKLLESTGRIIADVMGAEAAYVTPGCSAALALGAAACMAGTDPEKLERLPDTTGMKSEIIIQRVQRYKYDRCLTVSGAKLVEVGDEQGTQSEQIEGAICDKTAAIHYFAPGGQNGVIPIEATIEIGKKHSVPIIVDAASQVYPLENLKKYNAMGADIVCYGAKYFGAPNSTGILCGRKDLVESASLQGFIGFESSPYQTFGRPLKLDRQEIVAVVMALREWVSMDHQARLAESDKKVRNIQKELEGLPHVHLSPVPEGGPATVLRVTLDEQSLGKTAVEALEALRDGNPSIWVNGDESTLIISTPTVADGDEQVIAQQLKGLLAG